MKKIHKTRTVIGVVGSYRKGGIVDTAISAVLAGASENGLAASSIGGQPAWRCP
jgi:hypothetical protein